MAFTISILALMATFYQLYLQRVHNEKSLKPLPQIILGDHQRQIFVQIKNNGVGPLIVERILFEKNGIEFFNLEDCLSLDPKSYMHDVQAHEMLRQVILPNTFLEVFGMRFDTNITDKELNIIRQQLSVLKIKMKGKDIYNNVVNIERNLNWFARR